VFVVIAVIILIKYTKTWIWNFSAHMLVWFLYLCLAVTAFSCAAGPRSEEHATVQLLCCVWGYLAHVVHHSHKSEGYKLRETGIRVPESAFPMWHVWISLRQGICRMNWTLNTNSPMLKRKTSVFLKYKTSFASTEFRFLVKYVVAVLPTVLWQCIYYV